MGRPKDTGPWGRARLVCAGSRGAPQSSGERCPEDMGRRRRGDARCPGDSGQRRRSEGAMFRGRGATRTSRRPDVLGRRGVGVLGCDDDPGTSSVRGGRRAGSPGDNEPHGALARRMSSGQRTCARGAGEMSSGQRASGALRWVNVPQQPLHRDRSSHRGTTTTLPRQGRCAR